jgi:hypothetical protein
MPPGLSKKPSPPLPPSLSPLTQPLQTTLSHSFPQDSAFYQTSPIEKLNQFLIDPNMKQLLKDIINHTNVLIFLHIFQTPSTNFFRTFKI